MAKHFVLLELLDRAVEDLGGDLFGLADDLVGVLLAQDRGFTLGLRSSGESGSGDIRAHETLESLTRDVLNVVLPDDDECGEDHPWSWLADLARGRGLHVGAEDLRGLPYEVIFAEKVRRWLGLE